MINKFYKIFIQHKIFLALFIMMCIFAPYKINAATLSISPSSTNVSVGNITTIKVYVNTVGKYINNAEAILRFPIDMLDVISVTKSSSVFSLWVEEPSFSNNTGKITFNGGIPSPGFIGQSGYIASITFKAKKQGTASILFIDGAVRENDGLGTDILTAKTGSTISIVSSNKEEVKAQVKTPIKSNEKEIIPTTFNPTIRFDNNQGIIKLSDEENISNIDYYTLSIDDGLTFKVKTEQLINYEYYLPILNEGSHSVTIISFDKTGKYTEFILPFMSPSISIPRLSLSLDQITKDDLVVILGKTDYSNIKVNIILELNGNEIKKYTQTTGLDGSFSVTTDKINNIGLINIWAENILSDKVKSAPSERIYLKVNEKAIIKITLSILYPLLYIMLILVILLLIFIIIYLGWHKFFVLKKKVENESKQAILEIHKNMSLLKEDLKRQLELLESIKVDRSLNEREEAIFNEIKKNIDSVDIFIENKLKKML